MSEENINFIKSLSCHVCNRKPVDVHHWRSKGAGGTNSLDNLCPLCRQHHVEFHSQGAKTFYNKYKDRLVTNRHIDNLPDLDRGKHG